MSAAATTRPAHPADPGQPAPRDAHFPLFDSLRAIAALSIVCFHLTGFSRVSPTVQAYTGQLSMGVTIFFVISGFLLYRPFVRARLRAEPGPLTGAYAWRRFLRLVPAYWVALTVIALVLSRNEVFGTRSAYFYGFLQTFREDTAVQGIGQAWTLAVEMSFYVFLPIWAWVMARMAAKTARERLNLEIGGIAILVVIGFLYQDLVMFTGNGVRSGVASLALPHFIDQFAIGMGLAVASVWVEGKRPPPSVRIIARYPAIPWIVAGAAYWVASTQIGLSGIFFEKPTQDQSLELHYLSSVVALGLVLPAVFGNPRVGAVRQLLGTKVLLWVGLVSYAVYLWHGAVLRQLYQWGVPQDVIRATGLSHFIVWTVITLAMVLVIAAVSYYAIERPALKLKRFKLGEWPRGNPAAERLGRRLAALGALVLFASAVLDASRAAHYGFVLVACVVLAVLALAPRVPAWRLRTAVLIVAPGVVLFAVAVVRVLAAPDTASANGRMGGLWLAFLSSLGIMAGGWLLWRSWHPLRGSAAVPRRVRPPAPPVGPEETNRPPAG
jgi:peptidoglycan/LPS O-acetylase OafA/YrhL